MRSAEIELERTVSENAPAFVVEAIGYGSFSSSFGDERACLQQPGAAPPVLRQGCDSDHSTVTKALRSGKPKRVGSHLPACQPILKNSNDGAESPYVRGGLTGETVTRGGASAAGTRSNATDGVTRRVEDTSSRRLFRLMAKPIFCEVLLPTLELLGTTSDYATVGDLWIDAQRSGDTASEELLAQQTFSFLEHAYNYSEDRRHGAPAPSLAR